MTGRPTTRDRGGGIYFARRSDLRLRNISLSFDATTGELMSSPIIAEVRTDIFDHWLHIAERAAGDSESARRLALVADLDDKEAFSEALLQEYEASLLAITASAFALDAFFASTLAHAPEARAQTRSRYTTLYETFKRAFSLKE